MAGTIEMARHVGQGQPLELRVVLAEPGEAVVVRRVQEARAEQAHVAQELHRGALVWREAVVLAARRQLPHQLLDDLVFLDERVAQIVLAEHGVLPWHVR
ncbi:MAG: hypothetical protein P1U53_03270, partial [Sulfitobacter sp.]|nr:hypothetical protein [Sulfitobacter sp.]